MLGVFLVRLLGLDQPVLFPLGPIPVLACSALLFVSSPGLDCSPALFEISTDSESFIKCEQSHQGNKASPHAGMPRERSPLKLEQVNLGQMGGIPTALSP